MYIQGVLPWNSQKWVAPPPDEIARIRAEAHGVEEAGLGNVGEDVIAPHMSREDRAMAEEARLEKERELERSSGEGSVEYHNVDTRAPEVRREG